MIGSYIIFFKGVQYNQLANHFTIIRFFLYFCRPLSTSNPQDWKICSRFFLPFFLLFQSFTISLPTLYSPLTEGVKTRLSLESIALGVSRTVPTFGLLAVESEISGIMSKASPLRQGVATGMTLASAGVVGFFRPRS